MYRKDIINSNSQLYFSVRWIKFKIFQYIIKRGITKPVLYYILNEKKANIFLAMVLNGRFAVKKYLVAIFGSSLHVSKRSHINVTVTPHIFN